MGQIFESIGEIFGGGSGTSTPPVISIPPAPALPEIPKPPQIDQNAIAARRKAGDDARRRRRGQGRQSTILGGEVGSDLNLRTKTLLGE